MKKRKVTIKNGCVHFIYDDEMRPFLALGKASVKRASHVEPTMVDGEVRWAADMIDGPTLGPFLTRQEALDEEAQWLEGHGLGVR